MHPLLGGLQAQHTCSTPSLSALIPLPLAPVACPLPLQEDSFTLHLHDMGTIRMLTLRMDGTSDKPSWCLERAVLELGEVQWKGERQQVPESARRPPSFFVPEPDGWMGPAPKVRFVRWAVMPGSQLPPGRPGSALPTHALPCSRPPSSADLDGRGV